MQALLLHRMDKADFSACTDQSPAEELLLVSAPHSSCRAAYNLRSKIHCCLYNFRCSLKSHAHTPCRRRTLHILRIASNCVSHGVGRSRHSVRHFRFPDVHSLRNLSSATVPHIHFHNPCNVAHLVPSSNRYGSLKASYSFSRDSAGQGTLRSRFAPCFGRAFAHHRHSADIVLIAAAHRPDSRKSAASVSVHGRTAL